MHANQPSRVQQAMVRGDGRVRVGELLQMRRMRACVTLLMMARQDKTWTVEEVSDIERAETLSSTTVARYITVLERAIWA